MSVANTALQDPRRAAASSLAVVALVLGAALMSARTARADIYAFDKQHTNITFSWDRLGISRQSGRMLDVDGALDFDPLAAEEAKLDVTMKAAGLWTGVEVLDKHLRSADFFDVARHPRITFRSTGVKVTGSKTGEVVGDLTMLGITKPVTLLVTWNFTGEHPLASLNANFTGKTLSAFQATAKLARSDWGLTRATTMVSDEIEVVINAEFVRQ